MVAQDNSRVGSIWISDRILSDSGNNAIRFVHFVGKHDDYRDSDDLLRGDRNREPLSRTNIECRPEPLRNSRNRHSIPQAACRME